MPFLSAAAFLLLTFAVIVGYQVGDSDVASMSVVSESESRDSFERSTVAADEISEARATASVDFELSNFSATPASASAPERPWWPPAAR